MANLLNLLRRRGQTRVSIVPDAAAIALPDTNIFLHYVPLDQLDLTDVLSADDIHLLIAPQVLNELDLLKWDHPTAGVRERAREALIRLDRWLASPTELRPGTKISVANSPRDLTFRHYKLDHRVKDDHIVACALELKHHRPSSRVILITADTGPRLRAAAYSIEALPLPEKYMLPPARDEKRDELLRLQRELNMLRSRAPDMVLTFTDDSKTTTISLPEETAVDSQAVEAHIEATLSSLQRHPSAPAMPPAPKGLSSILRQQYTTMFSAFSQTPETENSRFQKEVAAFPNAYRKHIAESTDRQNRARRAVKIDFKLQNIGTALAEDIILNVELPQKMSWLASLDSFSPPVTPQLPTPPRTQLQLIALPPQRTQLISPQASPQTAPLNPRIKGPFIDRQVVTWEFPNLHHKSFWPLGPIWAYFPSAEAVSPFDIKFAIRERNTPDIVRGSLVVHPS